MKKILLIAICLLAAFAAFAQSNTDKVRQFERLLREWKSDGYSTGSEKYTQLMSMVTEGCRMSDYVAKSYIDDNNASSSFNIKAGSWFQYIKEKKISITLRDLREKTGDDGRRIVYCWIKYTQPGKHDREDFVGFKFDGGRIIYICNDDTELANRIKTDKEQNVVDTRQSSDNTPAQNVSQRQDNKPSTVTNNNSSVATHEYVDLGLPSGTLWATCNVGANNPWDYGDYFAWGETKPKSTYSWNNYKYCRDGSYRKLTKYCNKSDYGYSGFTDSKTVLDPSDDAATANWGSEWRMPTAAERDELITNCYWVRTTNYKGHFGKGYIVYKALKESDKGVKIYEDETADAAYTPSRIPQHIFLPAAGWADASGPQGVGISGCYWSSSLNVESPKGAHYLRSNAGYVLTYGDDSHRYGDQVRPVRSKN